MDGRKFIPTDWSSHCLGAEGIHLAKLVINILLFTTVITEVVGPLLTKKALEKAGEIGVIK